MDRGEAYLLAGTCQRTLRPPRARASTITFVLLSALLSACASLPGPSERPADNPRGLAEQRDMGTRRATGFAQAAGLGMQTWYIDPLIRPFSTQKSLYALVAKSAGGFVRRTAIDTIQFPLLEREPVRPVEYREGMDLDAWEQRLDRLLGRPASRGTIQFLVDGEEYFTRLADAIGRAESSIDVRTYIFDNDDVAVYFADLLRARSNEVKVRVLLDGVGSLLGTQFDSDMQPAHFTPPESMANYLRNASKVRVRTQTNPWLTGDHVKTTIIDRKLAFVGGMNIGREYRYEWHDMMMEVTGPVVHALQRDADKAWQKAGLLGDVAWLVRTLIRRKSQADPAGYPVRVLATRDHISEIYRAQLAAIRHARRYIYIENAYFTDDLVLYELAKARRRGVDVRVIIPDAGNHESMNRSNELAINTMLRNGIRVYRYPGMSHIKAAVFDGWACMGSANFDKMSLQINKEINLATSHPETVRDLLQRVFAPDFARSEEVLEPVPVNWTNRLAEFIADEAL